MSTIMWYQASRYQSKSEPTCYTNMKTINQITIKIKKDERTHRNYTSLMKFSDAPLKLWQRVVYSGIWSTNCLNIIGNGVKNIRPTATLLAIFSISPPYGSYSVAILLCQIPELRYEHINFRLSVTKQKMQCSTKKKMVDWSQAQVRHRSFSISACVLGIFGFENILHQRTNKHNSSNKQSHNLRKLTYQEFVHERILWTHQPAPFKTQDFSNLEYYSISATWRS